MVSPVAWRPVFLRMGVFISRRGRRAAWEHGAAVGAQHDTSLAIEQGFGGIRGADGK